MVRFGYVLGHCLCCEDVKSLDKIAACTSSPVSGVRMVMTKTEYHSILIHKLEQSNSDIQIWPPGISPGSMHTTAAMDDFSQSSLTRGQHQPLVEELESLSHESDSQDMKERHDEFMKILDTFEHDIQ